MNHKIILLLVSCLLMNVQSSLYAADSKETTKEADNTNLAIEYFTKPSETREVILSPDGKNYIAIINREGKDVFAVINIETKKALSLIGVRGSENNVDRVQWVNNDRIIYTIYEQSSSDQQKNHTGELFAVNKDGSKHEMIFGYRAFEEQVGSNLRKREASYASHRVIDKLENDDDYILIAYYPWKLSGGYWRPYDLAATLIQKLNVNDGRLKKVEVLPILDAHPIVDNNGDVRFAVGVSAENKHLISFKSSRDAEWEEFSLDNFEGTNVYPISFTEDNNSVYLNANVGLGTEAIYLFDLATKSIKKIFHDEKVDIYRTAFDFSGNKLIYVATALDKPKYHYLDPQDKKSILHTQLRDAFAGLDVVITSASKDGSKLMAYTYADNNPGDYYLFDTKTLDAQYIMSRNSWMSADVLLKSEPMTFTTRDKQTIYGYLTRPKNAEPNGLPLVVLPHGGPHGLRDGWGFDSKVQLLANQGYAVLQVNFRGSGGFGNAYQEAGYGKWGTLMQDDITDATKALIEQKIVNPKRICIYGASYGGYAALMGAVREPELYQCAIGSAGIYDLALWVKDGDIPNRMKNGLAYLKQAVGSDKADINSRSPVYNVEKIKANILLIHGAKDERVPISQANALTNAFDKIGKKYQWLEFNNEGHGLNGDENRLLAYQKILSFLKENIGSK